MEIYILPVNRLMNPLFSTKARGKGVAMPRAINARAFSNALLALVFRIEYMIDFNGELPYIFIAIVIPDISFLHILFLPECMSDASSFMPPSMISVRRADMVSGALLLVFETIFIKF